VATDTWSNNIGGIIGNGVLVGLGRNRELNWKHRLGERLSSAIVNFGGCELARALHFLL
jgi:hypothetical protein